MGKKNVTYLDGFPFSWGHRGYSSEAPENTMEAFSLCVERGVLGVELDVQLCKTGEIIVFHDSDLERITGYKGAVRDTPYENIRMLNAATHAPNHSQCSIPRFEEVCSTFPSLFIDIELKGSTKDGVELTHKVFEMITQYSMEDRVVVSSFNPILLRYFRRLTHRIPTAVIWSRNTPNKLISWGITKRLVPHTFTKPQVDILEGKRVLKKEILTWTENNPDKQRDLIARGIRVISDSPIGNI